MDYIHRTVNRFVAQTHLHGRITLSRLINAANRNGVIIKPYSASKRMLIMLRMAKESLCVPALCVEDQSNIMIFYDDARPKDEIAFAVAHELGHIKLQHGVTDRHITRQEKEADEFALYLLNSTRKYDALIKACTFMLALCLCAIAILTPWQNSNSTAAALDESSVQLLTARSEPATDNVCYFTGAGRVYHLFLDCRYLKACDCILTGTVDRCQKNRLCSACRSRLNNG